MSDLPVLNPYGLAPNMSKEEIYTLPLRHFTGRIILIDTFDAFYEAFHELNNLTLLGFDTETKPSFKKGTRNQVSLIQLANDELAVLIRINRIGIPEGLIDILSNSLKTKVGVAIKDDLVGLNKL